MPPEPTAPAPEPAAVKDGSIVGEARRRRTFAIISHPDAGKTTMTEKLLLYGKAVNEAGAVEGGRKRKATTSDWMDLEKRRGISVSSTVLRFDHDDIVINLLPLTADTRYLGIVRYSDGVEEFGGTFVSINTGIT